MAQIDVIIPARNPGTYLEGALASLLAQTFDGWRAVVIDDGSVEDLSWVGGVDPRIELIRQESSGVSAARNRGIASGSAPLIAFLDSDDLWLPAKLDRQLLAMQDDVVLCSTAFEIVDRSGARRGDGYEGFATSYRELLQGNGICTSTVMTRRTTAERAGLFDPALRHGEDWDLWIRIAALGRLVKLDDTLARYRIHDGNVSGNYLGYYRGSRTVLARHRSGDNEQYISRGKRRLRLVAGAQAMDAFRLTHQLRHLAWAGWLNPRLVYRTLANKALRR